MDGRPIPSPVGVHAGPGDTIGTEGDDPDLTGELTGVVVCSRAEVDFDGVWGGEGVVSWILDVSFNRRLDDMEFENILVVGVVSRDPPDRNPPTSCIFDRSRNCVPAIQQPILVFPRDSEEFAVAHFQLEKAVTSVVGAKYKQLILYCSYK